MGQLKWQMRVILLVVSGSLKVISWNKAKSKNENLMIVDSIRPRFQSVSEITLGVKMSISAPFSTHLYIFCLSLEAFSDSADWRFWLELYEVFRNESWRIQGAQPAYLPKSPDSFVLTHKFYETYIWIWHPWRGWCRPYGKSWICHWSCSTYEIFQVPNSSLIAYS